MNRQEHLDWCKQRAHEYINLGAWTSFASDMNNHDETRGHSALLLGSQMLFGGMLDDPQAMRKFIDGFN
jgi:hypothetical protein